MLSVCFKNLSHIRDLSALCKEGSLGQVRNLKPWEASLLKGRVTWQFSCNSGRAPVGSILIGVFMQWSSWLLGSGVNQMGVFILAVYLVKYFGSFHFWVLKAPFEIFFLRHLHLYRSQELSSSQVRSKVWDLWLLSSLYQITSCGQVYPHRPTAENTVNPVVSSRWCL